MKGNNDLPDLHGRLEHLYRLLLRYDGLFRSITILAQSWETEPAKHRREISITLNAAIMGVLEAYQEIKGF